MGDSKGPAKIAHSTLFNLAGVLVPTIVQLVTVPLYIRAIGADRYGVMTLVWLLLGYFGIFDLGFGKAIANQIATLARAPNKAREEVFWTGTCLSILAGFGGGLILYGAAALMFGGVFAVPHGLLAETKAALPLLIVALPVITGISALGGALQGRECFGVFNLSQMTGSVLYQVFPMLVAVFLSPTLPGLIAAAIIGRVVTFVMLYIFCITNIPARPIPYIVKTKIRALLGYGGWVALMGLINPILTVFDRFFIGAIAGMAAVAAYTIPYNLVLRIGALPSALQNALFPRFSMADEEKGLALLLIVVRGTAALLTPLLVFGMVMVKPFLTVWLGHKLAGETSSVGEILIVGLWAYTAVFIPSAYLQARKRPDVEPKFALFELAAYGPLLYVLTSHFGANGAAWAWDTRALVHTVLILWAIGILTTAIQIWVGLFLVSVTWAWVYLHFASGLEFWLGGGLLVVMSIFWSLRAMPVEVSSAVVARIRKTRRPPAAAGSKLS